MNQLIILLKSYQRLENKKITNKFNLLSSFNNPGETVFVPGEWWHAVFNLDDTIAVTQNFMTHNNFDKDWRSVRV